MELSTARLGDVPVPLRPLWNPETCPLEILPWLAWSLSVDTWDPNWPENIKRAVVGAAVDTARRKGTAKAVKDALAALGASTTIVEWFGTSPAGTPHTFVVYIVSPDTTIEMQAAMHSEIRRTKPLRSHYSIAFGTQTESSINIVGVLRPAVFVRLDGGATY